jgi:hypothetical protein
MCRCVNEHMGIYGCFVDVQMSKCASVQMLNSITTITFLWVFMGVSKSKNSPALARVFASEKYLAVSRRRRPEA